MQEFKFSYQTAKNIAKDYQYLVGRKVNTGKISHILLTPYDIDDFLEFVQNYHFTGDFMRAIRPFLTMPMTVRVLFDFDSYNISGRIEHRLLFKTLDDLNIDYDVSKYQQS